MPKIKFSNSKNLKNASRAEEKGEKGRGGGRWRGKEQRRVKRSQRRRENEVRGGEEGGIRR